MRTRTVFSTREFAQEFGMPTGTMNSFMRFYQVKGHKIGHRWYWERDSFWEAYDSQQWDDQFPPIRKRIKDGWSLSDRTIAKVEECLKNPR